MPFKDPKNRNPESSTQTHLKIAEIKDNVLVLKDGGLRSVLHVSSVNFNLKSEQEQNMIIYAYQEFLNFLEHPIQILIRSKKLDIEGYIKNLNNIALKQHDKLLQQATYDYINYVSQIVELTDIMDKDFYVIVPNDPFRTTSQNPFQKIMKALNPADSIQDYRLRKKEFANMKKILNQRTNNVRLSLERCGVTVERLNTHEIIKLFYSAYNPDVKLSEKNDDLTKMNIGIPPISHTEDEEEE